MNIGQWKARLLNLALDPYPLRRLTIQAIKDREIGDYQWRVGLGAVERPAYGWCVLAAAQLAKRLGLTRVSVVEFGVAGGNGLLALENHAEQVRRALGVDVEVYGFDTGQGLPRPTDYRDLPYHWKEGFFRMDPEALQARLRSAHLVLGEIRDTLPSFVDRHNPAPIGAVMHDMDLYSSTAEGLKLFDVEEKYRLPRIFTYFDDIIGHDAALYNDYTGERLAIAEFNESHPGLKISPAYMLSCRALAQWQHQIYVAHDFDHSHYNDFISQPEQQLPLSR
jgi:pimeloyl-ACP methyl ester carboxylesterase